jgi:hypothetical protein
MQKFWAFTHVGTTIVYAGDSWEEGGFSVDEAGNPDRDANRNTVASYSVDDLDPTSDADVALIRNAYAGDGDRVGDRDAFLEWLRGQGFDTGDRQEIEKRIGAEELTCRCLYCGRDVRWREVEGNPSEAVPASDDDEAWDEIAAEHEDDCEWAMTRAHRIELADAE